MVLALLDDASDKPWAASIEDLGPEDSKEDQLTTYASFCGTIFEQLFSRVDRMQLNTASTFRRRTTNGRRPRQKDPEFLSATTKSGIKPWKIMQLAC